LDTLPRMDTKTSVHPKKNRFVRVMIGFILRLFFRDLDPIPSGFHPPKIEHSKVLFLLMQNKD
jgi:hypothetical protein